MSKLINELGPEHVFELGFYVGGKRLVHRRAQPPRQWSLSIGGREIEA